MNQPLAGVKVLDLSMNLPGPYMTWLMALLGADVVKIENPEGGDYGRALVDKAGASPFFDALNRNKQSVALNLKSEAGKAVFLKLISTYDVVVEGFRPGVLDRLGVGYNNAAAVNPRVIYVAVSGYGQDGSLRDRASHDLNFLALSGILSITGTREGAPGMLGVQVADFIGGSLFGAVGLFAALMQRERSGRGQFVDVSMFDGAFAALTMIFGTVTLGMEKAAPGKMLLNGKSPCYNIYKTKEGRYMALAAIEYKFWANFCRAAGREDLLSQGYGGPEVIEQVATIFAGKTRNEWTEIFHSMDACCEPVLSVMEAADSRLVADRNMIATGPDGMRYVGNPLKMSECEFSEYAPAPKLGQHNEEILRQLGYTLEEREMLRREGAY